MSYESKPWINKYDKEVPPEIDPELFETTLIDLIMPSFKEFPDKFCAHFLGVSFTFADIDRLSNQFANMLVENGLQPGDVVGLSLVNTPQYLISYIGTLKAGCAATGLSPLFSESELEYQLKDANAKAVVVIDAAFAARLKNIADKLPNLKVIIATNVGDFLPGIKRFLGKLLKKLPKGKVTPLPGKTVLKFMDIIKKYPTTFEIRKTSPDDMCLLMYTGGTTGFPKGSILTNRSVCSNIIQMATWLDLWPDRGKDAALSGFPFFHIAGKTFCNMCLYTAGTQILIPNPRDTHLICKEIKKYHPSELVNVPSLYQMLMKEPLFKTLDFSNLKFAISSAAPFPAESINELEQTIGKGKLIEVYGCTECSPLTIMNPRKNPKKVGTVGLPISNTLIRLVNPDNEDVKEGEPGEIIVKGPQVMKGYLNKPEENKKVFDKDGWLHTGDVAIMDDDSYFRIVDRIKDMIIVSGYKVFSTKVEDILSKHPAIDMVALIGIPNPERPGSELVKAYVTIKPTYAGSRDPSTLKEEILAFAKEHLAPYEVPKLVEIRAEFPLSTVGKVLKKELRAEARKS